MSLISRAVEKVYGSTENAGPENERPMRDHLDQRATDTTGK